MLYEMIHCNSLSPPPLFFFSPFFLLFFSLCVSLLSFSFFFFLPLSLFLSLSLFFFLFAEAIVNRRERCYFAITSVGTAVQAAERGIESSGCCWGLPVQSETQAAGSFWMQLKSHKFVFNCFVNPALSALPP